MPQGNEELEAEQEYRDAFERLKTGVPSILKPGAAVTQSNVAREAGKERSSIKKKYYPTLVAEIQIYVEQKNTESKKQISRTNRRKRSLKEENKDLNELREELFSHIKNQDNYIETLLDEINELKFGKIVSGKM